MSVGVPIRAIIANHAAASNRLTDFFRDGRDREKAHWSWNSSQRRAPPQFGRSQSSPTPHDPLDDAVAAAKESLAKNLTWAIRFEISDHEGRLLFRWPEGISGNP
jgi:hypothetical protein